MMPRSVLSGAPHATFAPVPTPSLSGSFTIPDATTLATTSHSSSSLPAAARPPAGTCNAVLRQIVPRLLAVFLQNLRTDYERWASDPEYRRASPLRVSLVAGVPPARPAEAAA